MHRKVGPRGCIWNPNFGPWKGHSVLQIRWLLTLRRNRRSRFVWQGSMLSGKLLKEIHSTTEAITTACHLAQGKANCFIQLHDWICSAGSFQLLVCRLNVYDTWSLCWLHVERAPKRSSVSYLSQKLKMKLFHTLAIQCSFGRQLTDLNVNLFTRQK